MAEKIRKYAIVIFLTFLVWAWAFNELEKVETRPATLDIAKSMDSDILVTFDQPAPVEIDLEFKGTPDKIGDMVDRIEAGLEDLKFDYSPKDKNRPSPYPLNILEFVNNSNKLRKLELKVISSSVELVQVNIEKLEKKELKIQCVDENGIEIKAESIDPSIVNVYVKKGYTGDAKVVLTKRDIIAARKDYVTLKPFVELAPNDRRVGEPVKIVLPSEELPTDSVQTKRIGYSFGKNIMGRYAIVLENEDELISAISLIGTKDALDTYKNQDIHIFVVALDGDEKKKGIIPRPVIFNFPTEDVAAGHIRLAKDEPREARFKLIKLPQTPTK